MPTTGSRILLLWLLKMLRILECWAGYGSWVALTSYCLLVYMLFVLIWLCCLKRDYCSLIISLCIVRVGYVWDGLTGYLFTCCLGCWGGHCTAYWFTCLLAYMLFVLSWLWRLRWAYRLLVYWFTCLLVYMLFVWVGYGGWGGLTAYCLVVYMLIVELVMLVGVGLLHTAYWFKCCL